MQDGMNRREFLVRGAAGVAGAAVALRAGSAFAQQKPRIVVARGGGAADAEDAAYKRMKAALDKFGGFPDLVKGKKVLIKLNATDGGWRDANTSTQATTALLKLCTENGAKSITALGQEWGGWGAKRQGLPTLTEAIKAGGATIYQLPHYWVAGSENAYKLIEPQPEPWKDLMVIKDIFEPDAVLLNLPRLKTHPHCVFTSCIKNIIGLTRRMYGFHKVDERTDVVNRGDPATSDGWHLFAQKLGNAFKLGVGPRFALHIVDANEPNFGWRGPGKQRQGTFPAGLVLVGKDALALDVYGCKLLGEQLNKQTPGLYPEPLGDWSKGDSDFIAFNKTKTNYLKVCGELGVGEADLGKVAIEEVTV
jgi:uncharacterized protein (DUF362 family)